MFTHRCTLITLVAAALAIACCTTPANAQTQTRLKDPPPPKFSWGDFGAGLNISNITVHEYRKTDGTAGGPIYVRATHALDIDPDPNEKDPLVGGKEDIGIVNFQYALWRGSTLGADGAINRVGAAFFGGFRLTDMDDVGTRFSFLQIVNRQQAGTSLRGYPKIDGGGYRGKFNGDIPAYNANPGWNFDGANTQYDYFDVPSNNSRFANTASFETALVCYNGIRVQVLNDFTWSFTSDGMNGVSGMDVTEQAAASNSLLGLYRARFGDIYSNIGQGSCHTVALGPVPEPSTFALFGIGLLSIIGCAWRRRKKAA